MSREFTFFQFDLDEETVRYLLTAVPGVTPLPPDDREASDRQTGAESGGSRGVGGISDDEGRDGSTETSPGETDETTVESVGTEAHLDGTATTGEGATGSTKWTAPSTPWPGAPIREAEESSWRDRLTDKKTLLVGGVVALLGVVSAAAVWYLKFRDASGDVVRRGNRDVGRDATPDEPHADDADSRSYPIDVAPVVGIAFLAVATLVRRRVRSESAE